MAYLEAQTLKWENVDTTSGTAILSLLCYKDLNIMATGSCSIRSNLPNRIKALNTLITIDLRIL
jgi:hypothetical protein